MSRAFTMIALREKSQKMKIHLEDPYRPPKLKKYGKVR